MKEGNGFRGVLYAMAFIYLMYLNYVLLKPYVLLFVNAALLSTALRPTKRTCVRMLRTLSDNNNARTRSPATKADEDDAINNAGGEESMLMVLVKMAAEKLKLRQTMRAINTRIMRMNTSTMFLALSLGAACLAPLIGIGVVDDLIIAVAILALVGLVFAAIIYIVDRRVFWYRFFVSDDAFVSITLVMMLVAILALVGLVLAIGAAADSVYIATTAAGAVRERIKGAREAVQAATRLAESLNIEQYADAFGVSLIPNPDAVCAVRPDAFNGTMPMDAVHGGDDGQNTLLEVGSLYGYDVHLNVAQLMDGIFGEGNGSPDLAASYASYARDTLDWIAAGDGTLRGTASRLVGVHSASDVLSIVRGLAAQATRLASAVPGLVSMVNVNAVASAASTLRSLFEVGIERVLPFFTFVVDNVASFGLALVDILIFLAFTVEMLTVRYDIINLLVDLLHPDNDRISAATATAMDGSGGGSARRKSSAAVLADEIRQAIEDVIFFPIKLALTRCCCTILVMVVVGARCVFLSAFLVTCAAVIAPTVTPQIMLVPWSVALVIERRFVAAVALLVLHTALLSFAEEATLSTAAPSSTDKVLDNVVLRPSWSENPAPVVAKPFHSTLLSLALWLGAALWGPPGLVYGPGASHTYSHICIHMNPHIHVFDMRLRSLVFFGGCDGGGPAFMSRAASVLSRCMPTKIRRPLTTLR